MLIKELRITNYELRITNYELRITNYELRITNFKMQRFIFSIDNDYGKSNRIKKETHVEGVLFVRGSGGVFFQEEGS